MLKLCVAARKQMMRGRSAAVGTLRNEPIHGLICLPQGDPCVAKLVERLTHREVPGRPFPFGYTSIGCDFTQKCQTLIGAPRRSVRVRGLTSYCKPVYRSRAVERECCNFV